MPVGGPETRSTISDISSFRRKESSLRRLPLRYLGGTGGFLSKGVLFGTFLLDCVAMAQCTLVLDLPNADLEDQVRPASIDALNLTIFFRPPA